jgi:hypothetical protein
MEADIVGKSFDYEALGTSTAKFVRGVTSEIRERIGKAAQSIFEIGSMLLEVKGKLDHGQFGLWLQAEFGWEERTARRMMSVATAFKTDKLSDLNIAPSALYLLASPSTDPEVREEVITKAKAGAKIERKDVIAAKVKRVEAKLVEPSPITPNPDDIEPDPEDTPAPLPEPVKAVKPEPPKPVTDADYRAQHNAAIEQALEHLEADARAMAQAFGHVFRDGVHLLTNPESKRHASWTGTIDVLRKTAKHLKVNLIVPNPEKPGEFCSAIVAEQIGKRKKAS